MCSGAYNDIVENEFCKEFLIHLEKTEARDLSQINRLRFLNLDSNFSNFSLECGEKENSKPLTLFTTTQDYRPDTTSLSTYVQYFWTGGLCATILMLVLTGVSYISLFLSYWWMQSCNVFK